MQPFRWLPPLAAIFLVIALALDSRAAGPDAAPPGTPGAAPDSAWRIDNPHRAGLDLPRRKVQLHSHTTRSDGKVEPAEALRLYAECGYSAVAITDHNKLTVEAGPGGLVTIPGSELNDAAAAKSRWEGHHVGCLFIGSDSAGWKRETLPDILGQVVKEEALAVANHPDMGNPWTIEELTGVPEIWAMEIFNGNGYRYFMESDADMAAILFGKRVLWDQVLADGRRLWGVAVDDAHRYEKGWYDQGWLAVPLAEPTLDELRAALEAGDFYACRGPEGKAPDLAVSVEEHRAVANTATECEIRAIVDSVERASVRGTRLTVELSGEETYLRFEASPPSAPASVSYSQPLWISRE